jgi:acetolactate synthase I/III small subunit
MTNATVARAGQSSLPQGTGRAYLLKILVEDRPGSVDRVVGVLRRRRAHTHALTIGPAETSGLVVITAQVEDSEVGADHLVEQVRKIADVHQVTALHVPDALTRELALIVVNANAENTQEIVAIGQQFAAHLINSGTESVTFEVTSSPESVEKLISVLQPYGVRELARSGSLAVTRATANTM